ncbi:MAG: hypothetical protein F6J98_08905 [Moorea sp. SIO4G2]|nr:hypothetical protein [Moorena sp. SIO4G2]
MQSARVGNPLMKVLHRCNNQGRYAPVLRPLTDLHLNIFDQMDNSK